MTDLSEEIYIENLEDSNSSSSEEFDPNDQDLSDFEIYNTEDLNTNLDNNSLKTGQPCQKFWPNIDIVK